MADVSGAEGGALHAAISVEEIPEDQRQAFADAAVDHTAEALVAAGRGLEAAERKKARAAEDVQAAELAAEHARTDYERAQADHDAAVRLRDSMGGDQ